VLHIEEELSQPGTDPGEMNRRYLALTLPEDFQKSFRERLRKDTQAVLNSREPYPLSMNACALNRFLTSCLLTLDALEYRRGSIHVERERDGYRVGFDEAPPEERFDQVIVRHGPQPSLAGDLP
jgi:hypothetical protein